MIVYGSLVTAVGAAQLTNAFGLGGTVSLTQFAVGTGENDAEYNPVETQTELKAEVYRGAINSISTVSGQPNLLEINCIVPVTEGGWYVREVGIFDDVGNLIVIANYPESYKPLIAEGAAQDFNFKILMATTNTAQVQLKVDPAIVLASKQFVLDNKASNIADISGLEDALKKGVPTGAILTFTSSVPPTGFIKLNGAILTRATYSDLWTFAQASGNLAVSEGTKDTGQFGPGDGATTFSIPDLRGEFIRGWDDGRGADTGRVFGSFQDFEVQSHRHEYIVAPNSASGSSERSATGGTYAGQYTEYYGGSETRPRNVALLHCIKF